MNCSARRSQSGILNFDIWLNTLRFLCYIVPLHTFFFSMGIWCHKVALHIKLTQNPRISSKINMLSVFLTETGSNCSCLQQFIVKNMEHFFIQCNEIFQNLQWTKLVFILHLHSLVNTILMEDYIEHSPVYHKIVWHIIRSKLHVLI